MKNKIYILISTIILICGINNNAAGKIDCTEYPQMPNGTAAGLYSCKSIKFMESGESKYYEFNGGKSYYEVQECNCPTGYAKIYSPIGDCNREYVSDCKCGCKNCSTEPTQWQDSDTPGYQFQTLHLCSCETGKAECNPIKHYRCAKGYYGRNIATQKTGCTQCPNGGTTTAAGAANQNACYTPKDTSFEDETGYGIYGDDCTPGQ